MKLSRVRTLFMAVAAWAGQHRMVLAGLALALLVRIVTILLVFNTPEPYFGDTPHYFKLAGRPLKLILVGTSMIANKSTAPLYPLFLAPFVNLLPEWSLQQTYAILFAQALVDTGTVAVVFLIARRLFDERVAWWALILQALDFRYIFAADVMATETLFIFLMALSVLLYLRAHGQDKLLPFGLAGFVLGLATLTRYVPLLFPAVLVLHAWRHPLPRRQARLGAAWLVAGMALLVVPWLLRVAYVSGDIPLPGLSHLWQSTQPYAGDMGPEDLLQARREEGLITDESNHTRTEQYMRASLSNILADPFPWLSRIGKETALAYLEPYGIIFGLPLNAPGIREVGLKMLRGESSLGELISLPLFFPRVMMYISHYWCLVFGVLGIVRATQQGRLWESFPLLGWIVYATAVVAVLLVEPRYLFPVMFALTVYGAYATDAIGDAVWRYARATLTTQPQEQQQDGEGESTQERRPEDNERGEIGIALELRGEQIDINGSRRA